MDASSSPKPSCVHAALKRLWEFNNQPTLASPKYPPISSIPRTPSSRLETATSLKALPDDVLPSSSPLAAPYLADPSTSTVLYLAYGSNLSAETFLGRRGIRPISSINVSAPSLQLTFDLPGFAYQEPCFANTAPRKLPKPPKLPPGFPDPLPDPPPGFSFPPNASTSIQDGSPRQNAHGDPTWDKGLIGVVYEVTPEDYATIVKTEGGGASYQDILVPCIELPVTVPGIPEKPPVPELPKPFLAHTLYAPRIPKKPDDGDGDNKDGGESGDDDDHDDGDDDDSPLERLKRWWRNLLLQPPRPDPEYAQPSARYLKLITDGAAEHNLPGEYQRWLGQLQPYTITSRKQKLGKVLFLAVVMPFMLLYLSLGRVLADDAGRVPVWFGLAAETFFRLVWKGYDYGFKPVFGDGERTVEGEDEVGRMGRGSVDEEKGTIVGG